MIDSRSIKRRLGKGVLAVALAGAMAVVGAVPAFAATQTPFGNESVAANNQFNNLLKTYGVRAGSAGPDYLGVTNTNFDFTSGRHDQETQYDQYRNLNTDQLRGLSIWGSSVNQKTNPYYQNLLHNALTGEANAVTPVATTWMKNPLTSSWGDSLGVTSHVGNVSTGAQTIAGLEYSPQIIFGANKYVNWNLNPSGDNSATNIYEYGYHNDGIKYLNNDATNLWTQIYTIGKLAEGADAITSTTDATIRYDSAKASAINYERAIKGQMLNVARVINNNEIEKPTIAYLYAIDASGTAHFFTPTAEGLLVGDDTGANAASLQNIANDNYAANDSTINMGYMAALPFVSNTYSNGNTETIKMKVEDIWKNNPACTLAAASEGGDTALANVDVIIFNSTRNTNLNGTSGGRNSSGVNNDYQGTALDNGKVQAWAQAHGYTGRIIAGDDWGTSSQQQSGIVTAPSLYCQRNYTADKNTRAAWVWSQVFPQLYGDNANASYAYWVEQVYHVNIADVPTVVAAMTNQNPADVTYNAAVRNAVENNAEAGYNWVKSEGFNSTSFTGYKYYNGSSRASYYSNNPENTESAEPSNTIGIFEPSQLWVNAH